MATSASTEDEECTVAEFIAARPPRASRSDPRAAAPYAWMLFAAAAFAVMGACTRAAGEHVDWRLIALARASLALLFSVALAAATGVKLIVFAPRSLWIRDLAGSLSLVCTFYALTKLPVPDTLTLTNMFPLWVVILSWPLLGQPPTVGVVLAAGVGLAGVVLMQQPHLDGSGTWAGFVAFFASLTSAVAMLGLHRLKHLDPRAIVAHFSAVAVATMLLTLVAPGAPPIRWGAVETTDVFLLLGVGVAATAGQLAITRAFATGQPAKVSVVALTQVAFGAGFDVAIWNRTFGWATVVGMLLILAPTAWVLVRRAQRV